MHSKTKHFAGLSLLEQHPAEGRRDLFEEENVNPGVSNDTLVEVDISESVLVDTDGIPQVCLPYLTETTTQRLVV